MIAEEAILSAARVLFTTEVNTALAQIEEEEADEVRCPNLEAHTGFGVHPDHPGSFKLSIADVETEEKDRIIKVSRYALYAVIEASGCDADRQCYRYAAAVGRALRENPTLRGIASFCTVTRKVYTFPKIAESGERYRLTVTIAVTMEEI
jgi:hypothetical protein